MVWVVDGLRRERDRPRFFELLARASIVKAKPLTFAMSSNECALLRDWLDSRKPVFFDFGDNGGPGDPLSFPAPVLWRFKPRSPMGEAHLLPILKTSFLDTCLKGLPLKGMGCSVELARAFRVAHHSIPPAPRPLIGFERYLARQERTRRHF
jgi:hypothetical protein